jgi:pimeloyl-ACP methyl ester carboxylesterase
MKWLFLRGLSREKRQWENTGAIFESVVPGAEVVTLDNPGAGTEHKRSTPLTVREMAEDVRSRWLLVRGDSGEPWSILGMSLGGMITMAWASMYPGDFENVVIVNSSAANLSVPWKRLDIQKLPGVIAALRETDRVKRERLMLDMTTAIASDAIKNELAERWAGYSLERPMTRVNALRQILAGSRFQAPSHIASPTLVLSGASDPFVDPSCPKRLADYLKADLATHPKAGHDLSVDAPEWMAEEVAKWLAKSR